jgi:hypothetical protein
MRKNAIISSTMQAGEECNPMKCNENVENASECMSMHLNAYGKKQHHFREKTTLIPGGSLRALRPQSTARDRRE